MIAANRIMNSRAPTSKRYELGFTMIELLVAMVIGLLGVIVIFTVYQNAEAYKRTTVAAGDAQSSGAIALYTIEQYIRTSGSGIATTNEVRTAAAGAASVRPNLLLGCPLQPNPNGQAVVPASPTIPASALITGVAASPTPVAPVRIVDGSQLAGANAFASDVLVIMASNADIATNPSLSGPIASGATAINVTTAGNLLGWRLAAASVGGAPPRPADIALFVQGGSVGNATISASPCAARRITNLAVPAGGGIMTLASALPAGVNYTPATNVHNLGPTPYLLSIGVNQQLQLVERNFTAFLSGEGPVTERVLADGIVNMQAQYGVDDDFDDVINRWVEPTGVWANVTAVQAPTNNPAAINLAPAINKIKAIRLAILARSVQYEAPNRTLSPPACDATAFDGTPLLPSWRVLLPVGRVEGTGVNASLAYPAGPDILQSVINAAPAAVDSNWRCYRYRSFETIIPLINMVRSPL